MFDLMYVIYGGCLVHKFVSAKSMNGYF